MFSERYLKKVLQGPFNSLHIRIVAFFSGYEKANNLFVNFYLHLLTVNSRSVTTGVE